MSDNSGIDELIGADVRGADGVNLETVAQVAVDDETQRAAWVTIRTDLFGSSESFAPLDDAGFEGGVLRTGSEKPSVKDVPRIATAERGNAPRSPQRSRAAAPRGQTQMLFGMALRSMRIVCCRSVWRDHHTQRGSVG
ncbi:PRC-barrel domain-containing protein [Curtobacterium sp. MCBD17_040]|uniref:PRC-barrel domain-containing protein n=1 Tax=Curtobacterium sp. MCBD17_040 TaxID=2175674 RepID=UPI000DAA993A|nr:PRC-barrel domain-containing protein [Curtobacterium sp. MCBD17_040]WIB63749.1 PRC-barrel domain-containing protein [Curtobacterium sp. MCBD17_040]